MTRRAADHRIAARMATQPGRHYCTRNREITKAKDTELERAKEAYWEDLFARGYSTKEIKQKMQERFGK